MRLIDLIEAEPEFSEVRLTPERARDAVPEREEGAVVGIGLWAQAIQPRVRARWTSSNAAARPAIFLRTSTMNADVSCTRNESPHLVQSEQPGHDRI